MNAVGAAVDNDGFFSELIIDDIQQVGICLEAHLNALAAEHGKRLFAMLGNIQRFRARIPVDGFVRHLDIKHTVNAVTCRILVLVVIADEVVIVICKHHRHGIDDITLAILTKLPFTAAVEVEIPERDFPLGEDTVLYGIDAVIDALVGVLRSVELDDIALQDLRTVAAAESRDLVNKFRRLSFGDETCRLYSVDENAKFGDIEAPVHHIIRIAMLPALTDDLVTERV